MSDRISQNQRGIEFDHAGGDSVLSAVVKDGTLELDIGEDWAGRHHGPDRPQGFQRYLDFKFTREETRVFANWLQLELRKTR